MTMLGDVYAALPPNIRACVSEYNPETATFYENMRLVVHPPRHRYPVELVIADHQYDDGRGITFSPTKGKPQWVTDPLTLLCLITDWATQHGIAHS